MTGVDTKNPQTPFIDEADIPLFLAFKKYREEFMLLHDAGVFELSHGKVTINKHEGHVQSIHLEQRTYQYKTFIRP